MEKFKKWSGAHLKDPLDVEKLTNPGQEEGDSTAPTHGGPSHTPQDGLFVLLGYQ